MTLSSANFKKNKKFPFGLYQDFPSENQYRVFLSALVCKGCIFMFLLMTFQFLLHYTK